MKKSVLGVLLIALTVGGVLACGDANSNVTSEMDTSIISDISIADVKLSELHSLNDFLTKLPNSKISSVWLEYEDSDENGCETCTYDELLTDQVVKENLNTVIFNIDVTMPNGVTNISFSTHYNIFKEKQKESEYFCIDFIESKNSIKLKDKFLETLTVEDIKQSYQLATRSQAGMYYIDFKMVSGDQCTYTGYPNSSTFQIFNTSERDRNS